MSPVSPVIDKSTFLTPAATNYHIIGLTGISFGRPWPKSNEGYLNCFCLSGQAVMETLAGVRKIDMARTEQRGGGGVICSHNWSISEDWTTDQTDCCSQFTSHMHNTVTRHNYHVIAHLLPPTLLQRQYLLLTPQLSYVRTWVGSSPTKESFLLSWTFRFF